MGLLGGLLGGGDKPKQPEIPQGPSPEQQLFDRQRAEAMARAGMSTPANFQSQRRLPQLLGGSGQAPMPMGGGGGGPQQGGGPLPELLGGVLARSATQRGDSTGGFLGDILGGPIFGSILGKLF